MTKSNILCSKNVTLHQHQENKTISTKSLYTAPEITPLAIGITYGGIVDIFESDNGSVFS